MGCGGGFWCYVTLGLDVARWLRLHAVQTGTVLSSWQRWLKGVPDGSQCERRPRRGASFSW